MPLNIKSSWKFHKIHHILAKNYKEQIIMDGVEGIRRERHFSEDIIFNSSEFQNPVNVSHTLKLIKINDDAKRTQIRTQKETTNKPHLLEMNIHVYNKGDWERMEFKFLSKIMI